MSPCERRVAQGESQSEELCLLMREIELLGKGIFFYLI